MSTPVVTVLLDDALAEVKRIFDNTNIRHLIVTEQSKLFGIVAERDLLRAISPYADTNVFSYRDIATLNKRVHQIMMRNPLFLNEDAHVRDALALFQTSHIGCIPIVDDRHVPVGIVTRGDILRHFYDICSACADTGE